VVLDFEETYNNLFGVADQNTEFETIIVSDSVLGTREFNVVRRTHRDSSNMDKCIHNVPPVGELFLF